MILAREDQSPQGGWSSPSASATTEPGEEHADDLEEVVSTEAPTEALTELHHEERLVVERLARRRRWLLRRRKRLATERDQQRRYRGTGPSAIAARLDGELRQIEGALVALDVEVSSG